MIYIAEAHADDVWPLGYGINQAKSLQERHTNCQELLAQQPQLADLVDAVFLDNMENEFSLKTGAWPEGYFIADKQGSVQWKCTVSVGSNCNEFAESA